MGLKTNQYLVGVMATGNMTLSSIEQALTKIKKMNNTTNGDVDILLHPGGLARAESATWTSKQGFKLYYASADRSSEAQLVKSEELAKLIRLYENIFRNR